MHSTHSEIWPLHLTHPSTRSSVQLLYSARGAMWEGGLGSPVPCSMAPRQGPWGELGPLKVPVQTPYCRSGRGLEPATLSSQSKPGMLENLSHFSAILLSFFYLWKWNMLSYELWIFWCIYRLEWQLLPDARIAAFYWVCNNPRRTIMSYEIRSVRITWRQ